MMNRNHPLFAGMGGHHSARSATDEWLTPPGLIEALGGAASFDLDPCALVDRPWDTALRHLTVLDNGLRMPWEGRAWVNPPYSAVGLWLARLAHHGAGTALIFARTETAAFFDHAWERATALLFMRGRINFHLGRPWTDPRTGRRYAVGDRAPGNAGAPTVLCAYGVRDADVLAFCGVAGQFVPLRLPRFVLVEAVDAPPTWRQALEDWFAALGEPVALADIYRAFADHPKAARNPHWRDKLRQTLQQGAFRRVDRGLWERA